MSATLECAQCRQRFDASEELCGECIEKNEADEATVAAPFHTLQSTIDHLDTFPAGRALLARLERTTADLERYRNECHNLTQGICDAHAELDKVVDADGEHALSGTIAERIAQLRLGRVGIAP